MRASIFISSFLISAATFATASPLAWRPFVPIEYDTWIWKDVGGNVCADGSQTGYAYNMHADADEVVIYLAGGGSCWDTDSCFTNPRALNLKGYNSSSFFTGTEAALDRSFLLTSRNPAKNNPWINAHYVYVPYCTGDLHGGDAVVTYAGAPRAIYHKGYINFQNILKDLTNGIPLFANVWLSGTSAGCYGATFNYDSVKNAFPLARTHLIGDSCESTPGFLATKPSWNLTLPSAQDCPLCRPTEFNTFLPALSMANVRSRFAAMSFAIDSTIPRFMDVSMSSFSVLIAQYLTNVTLTPTNLAKSFTLPGQGHGVLYQGNPISATGVPVWRWLASMRDLSSVFEST